MTINSLDKIKNRILLFQEKVASLYETIQKRRHVVVEYYCAVVIADETRRNQKLLLKKISGYYNNILMIKNNLMVNNTPQSLSVRSKVSMISEDLIWKIEIYLSFTNNCIFLNLMDMFFIIPILFECMLWINHN